MRNTLTTLHPPFEAQDSQRTATMRLHNFDRSTNRSATETPPLFDARACQRPGGGGSNGNAPPPPPPELLDSEPNRSDTPFGCVPFVFPGMEMEKV